MQEYIIEVSEIEALQTVQDRDSLERIFVRAKSTIVNGEKVVLARKSQRFDEFTTLEELKSYRSQVFKYVN